MEDLEGALREDMGVRDRERKKGKERESEKRE